jgi:hypothetical protein
MGSIPILATKPKSFIMKDLGFFISRNTSSMITDLPAKYSKLVMANPIMNASQTHRYAVHLAAALPTLQLHGQEAPHFLEKLTTEEGLSSNHINAILQDKKGFLWIATSDGLNRFDGTEVVQYFHDSGSCSLPHNYVYCLQRLENDMLAAGTQKGLAFYNGKTGAFRRFFYSSNNKLDEHNISSFK